ncbi:MAG: lysophospholipid acyltransferase family protein, partial [Acidobacteriota bacterium]
MARPPTVARRVRWWVEYGAVRAFSALIGPLPHRLRLMLGRALGRLVHAVDARHRGIALDNLRMACPDRDARWRRATARAAFEHLGRLLVEILVQGRERDRLTERLSVEGWEHVERAASSGRGYFLLSGHFGNWEWIALEQGARGLPLWMVARPLDNPRLEGFFAARRQSTGNRVVYKRNAVREMVRGLKGGHGIAFMVDQDYPQPGAHFPPFFGIPAATTPALGTLAARLGVPVVPVFSYPEGRSAYRVVYEAPIESPGSGDLERDALAISIEATRRLEAA